MYQSLLETWDHAGASAKHNVLRGTQAVLMVHSEEAHADSVSQVGLLEVRVSEADFHGAYSRIERDAQVREVILIGFTEA